MVLMGAGLYAEFGLDTKPVGARLAGDGDLEGVIAGKPGSYRGGVSTG